MSLWNEKTASEATGGKASGSWQASHVSIDSRSIRLGDLFVALKGDNFDGHDYIADAFKKGAVAAIVSQQGPHPTPLPQAGEGSAEGAGEGNLLLVPDTFKALEDLGRFARARSRAKIIGVTGSVGKTSTKEMISLALSAHGSAYATSGNFNNHIGTPLSLANLPPEAQFAVFEMGMNHAGEISALTKMVRPQVAVITNVESVHLEFFGSETGIADAKSEIFDGMDNAGIAVLNADNGHFQHLKEAAGKRGIERVIACGAAPKADCRLLNYHAIVTGCEITASIFGRELRYRLSTVGKHWALTSLLTLAAAHALGLDDEKTARALENFSEPEGRGRVARLNDMTLIDDSYNASPTSMRAAFAKTLEVWEAAGKKGRKIAALGDMLELGKDSAALHESLAESLKNFDAVFTAGPLMRSLHDALPAEIRGGHTASAKELLPVLQAALRVGDIVLIKGSHGSKMYELASSLRQSVNRENKEHAV